jgi:hypothetical protein
MSQTHTIRQTDRQTDRERESERYLLGLARHVAEVVRSGVVESAAVARLGSEHVEHAVAGVNRDGRRAAPQELTLRLLRLTATGVAV